MTATKLQERLICSVGRKFEYRVNCFCVSQFYYRETQFRNCSADEMLDFVAQSFQQVTEGGVNVLTLVWSRSSFEVQLGQIRVQDLAQRRLGFPNGLVLEHSFVQLDERSIFHKADPSPESAIEIISLTAATAPYVHLEGYELTWHSPNFQIQD